MTIHGYGRVMPLQLDMLCLGGDSRLWVGRVPLTDCKRLARMKEAHKMLKLYSGRDLGYDLAAWHHFLMSDRQLRKEYTFHYAWRPVRRRVEELLDDPDRLRLVQLLEEEGDPVAAAESESDE